MGGTHSKGWDNFLISWFWLKKTVDHHSGVLWCMYSVLNCCNLVYHSLFPSRFFALTSLRLLFLLASGLAVLVCVDTWRNKIWPEIKGATSCFLMWALYICLTDSHLFWTEQFPSFTVIVTNVLSKEIRRSSGGSTLWTLQAICITPGTVNLSNMFLNSCHILHVRGTEEIKEWRRA